jgi:hypothetical protein
MPGTRRFPVRHRCASLVAVSWATRPLAEATPRAQPIRVLGGELATVVCHLVGLADRGPGVLRTRMARREWRHVRAMRPPALLGRAAWGRAHDGARRGREPPSTPGGSMKTVMSANPPKKHRCPAESIHHAGWLYFCVCLSYRDGGELLFARGIIVTYESIRQWSHKFGQRHANH